MSSIYRKIALILFAGVLLAGGGYLLFEALARPGIYRLLRGGGTAVILIGLALYMLWDDFIRPPRQGQDR